MALTAQETRDVWRALLQRDGALASTLAKPDLQAAVTAVDAWCTTNQASFVAAIPEPFKSASNAAQKALLLSYVAMKRGGVI